jgi:hypothetical protein
MPPLQHPFGQVLLSHRQTPSVVSQSLFGQLVHAFPPMPHCRSFSAVSWMQVLPLQQPLGQEAASHTHWPVLGLHS